MILFPVSEYHELGLFLEFLSPFLPLPSELKRTGRTPQIPSQLSTSQQVLSFPPSSLSVRSSVRAWKKKSLSTK